jgi:hypothetical protein
MQRLKITVFHTEGSMRRASILFIVSILLIAWTTDADARRRRRRRRKAPKKEKVNKRAAAAIAALTGKYKWGLGPMKTVKLLTANLKKDYIKRIRQARSTPREQDRLRKELRQKIAKVKRSYYKFTGKRGGWDSSIVDDQFSHSNQESIVVYLEAEQQRFFFFHNGKLYKQFIAFNADHKNYKGLNFPQFLGKLIKLFGTGSAVFKKDLAGQSRLHHVEWIGAKKVRMWAVDKSTIYGNFCIVLFHSEMKEKVLEGRKLTGGRRRGYDPMIDSVTKPRKETDY